MYYNDRLSVQVAQAKQRDMLAAAERERRARQIERPATESRPSATRRTGAWVMRQLRPQVQS
jgi:hypothetical protein